MCKGLSDPEAGEWNPFPKYIFDLWDILSLIQIIIPSLATLHIKKLEQYSYLSNSKCYSIETVDDQDDFQRVRVCIFYVSLLFISDIE